MKNLRYLASISAVVAALIAVPAAFAQTAPKEIHIGTEGAYAPWNFTKPDGTVDGFEIDLAHDLCARMRVTCTIAAQSYDSLIPSLNAGKIDAIMAAMSVTPKREEAISFTRSYGSTGQTFATIKGSPLASLPDTGKVFSLMTDEAGALKELEKIKPLLQGKKIGVQSGAISEAFLEKYMKGVVTLQAYKSTEQHDLDLLSGRVDAVFTSPAYLMTAVKKPGNEEMIIAGPRFQGGILGRGSAVGIRKSDTDLRDKFDAAVKAAQDDGAVERLSAKWFGFDVTPR
jgi:octopine/nopaline transport system substrate-binding protein